MYEREKIEKKTIYGRYDRNEERRREKQEFKKRKARIQEEKSKNYKREKTRIEGMRKKN